MRWVQALRMRLRALVRADAVDRELADEMRCHFEHLVEANLARGMPRGAVRNFNLLGTDEPERLMGATVSANLFSVLRVAPLLGRPFAKGEDTIGHDRVAILSYGLWKRRFAADPGAVGRTISLSGVPHT